MILTDEFGIRWSMPEDAPYYMDITLNPLAKASLADVRAHPSPEGRRPGRLAGLRERALALKNEIPMPWSAAYRASCMRFAGTCAAWSNGSAT